MLLSLGGVLTGIVQLAVIVGFFYGIYLYFRVEIRRGHIRFPNPFMPGWRQLHNRYGSAENLHSTELVSGWIGWRPYTDLLKIKFDTQDIWIRNTVSTAVLVRIPYTDIEVLQAPVCWQLTRFSEKEYTNGKFRANGVVIELPAYWATQLLGHMAASTPS
ncbi:hypothetical protein [Hymenobacter guriensis]|uniref:Uncharacterized protein n=1 Tax=Hymenobacter guriensis TaxID=2793065 RepID=A0ABS0L814_9BACT|nr:hypothetical protein [Hymenobacter guriensis]MBG8556206.1 hypothetical protein [Hymenobacter guriensis]